MAICIFRCRACKSEEFERRNVQLGNAQFCRDCGEQLDNVSLGEDLKNDKLQKSPVQLGKRSR